MQSNTPKSATGSAAYNDSMQQPPQWSIPPTQRRTNWVTVVLIGCGALAAMTLLCCGGGALFFWRSGGGDIVSCSNLTMAGEYKKAIPACRDLVAKMPKLAGGHNNLGWCLALDGQGPEAVVEAQKAVDLEPNPNSYDTLAMALAVSGRGDEALKVETDHVMNRSAVQGKAQHVTLGMAYYAAGRKQEAHRQWEIARTSLDAHAQRLAREFERKYP